MKRTISDLCLVIFAAMSVLPCFAAGAEPERGDPVGMDVSGFSTFTFDGETVDGSVFGDAALTVVNFWETSCGPCIQEMRYFQQAQEYYDGTPEADAQFLICLYTDESPNVPDAIEIMEQNGYELNNIVIDEVLLEMLTEGSFAPDMIGFPQTFFIDSSGTVRYHHYGVYHSCGELRSEIEAQLAVLPPVTPAEPSGDVDGDGSVTVSDALICLRAAMGVIPQDGSLLLEGDIDCDGELTVADALAILRRAMGICPAP